MLKILKNLDSLNDAHLLAVSVARLGRGLVALGPGTRPDMPLARTSLKNSSEDKEVRHRCGWRGLEENEDVSRPLEFSARSTAAQVLQIRRPQPNSCEKCGLELYEFEGCPYCRKVREVFTELDLDYISRASPKGDSGRAALVARGGRSMVPFLHDPNTGAEMYESEDIIDYLHDTYGSGRATIDRVAAPLNTLGSALASAFRPKGIRVDAPHADRTQPDELLVRKQTLFSSEANVMCLPAVSAE